MKRVLFVCLGNICRSPAAEGVLSHLLKQEGLDQQVHVDSAGTGAYHVGEPADGRMRHHASERGYHLTSIARQFQPTTDFEGFDYIVAMDNSNYQDLLDSDTEELFKNKVHKMVDFCTVHNVPGVPDPYYQGADGFELVLDIVEDGCQGLISQLKNDLR